MATVADPVTQALIALCSHPSHVAGCEACEIRRVECAVRLAHLAEATLGGLR